MLRKLLVSNSNCFQRSLASSSEPIGAGTSTGIEHAVKFQQIGKQHKQNFKDYKCSEYLHFSTYSYYDKEVRIF